MLCNEYIRREKKERIITIFFFNVNKEKNNQTGYNKYPKKTKNR